MVDILSRVPCPATKVKGYIIRHSLRFGEIDLTAPCYGKLCIDNLKKFQEFHSVAKMSCERCGRNVIVERK